jgi:hypothetical protein
VHNNNRILQIMQEVFIAISLQMCLVPQAGVEPTTSALGVPCSIL